MLVGKLRENMTNYFVAFIWYYHNLHGHFLHSIVNTNVLKIESVTEPKKLPIHDSLIGLTVEP